MKLRDAILAESETLPTLGDLVYRYILAGNGLFIEAEDSRLHARVPIAHTPLHGLAELETEIRLKVPTIPESWLFAVWDSARRHLPNEVMFQFTYRQAWHCRIPQSQARQAGVTFEDDVTAIVDLHSHGTMAAFFSETDDRDEQGLRIYAVIGQVDQPIPTLMVRVGVYGHTHWIPATTIFEGLGPFRDLVENPLGDDEPEYQAALESWDSLKELEPICERLASAHFSNCYGALQDHEDWKRLREIAKDWKGDVDDTADKEEHVIATDEATA